MRSFNGFDVQVHDACGVFGQRNINEAKSSKETFMFTNSGISRICQWTRLTITQAGDIVFVTAKVLGDGPNKSAIRAYNSGDDEPTHLTLYEQNCWFMTDQMTSSLCIFNLRQRETGARTNDGREKADARDSGLTSLSSLRPLTNILLPNNPHETIEPFWDI